LYFFGFKEEYFGTNNGYFIDIRNRLTDVIARKEMTLEDDYKIVKQHVLKKYHMEPHYVVVTNSYIQEFNLGYLEFEYKVSKNK